MGGRSLSAEENARVAAAVRELLQRGETQISLAPVLGVKQSTISSLLSGRHRAGYGFARNVAKLVGMAVDDLLRGSTVGAVSMATWRDQPDVVVALEEARRTFPNVSVEAWAWVEGLAGSPPPSTAPVFFWTLATAYANAPREPATPAVAREGSGVRQKGRK